MSNAETLTAAERLVLTVDGPFTATPRGSCRADAERLADRGLLVRVPVEGIFPGQYSAGFMRTPAGDAAALTRPLHVRSER